MMMGKRVAGLIAAFAAAAWTSSMALAQTYPGPGQAPQPYSNYPSAYGTPAPDPDYDAADDEDAPLPPSGQNASAMPPVQLPSGPILSPDDPRYARQVPQGPVMSPNDPRYGQPAYGQQPYSQQPYGQSPPPAVYSDRAPGEQGGAGYGDTVRPPQGIGQQATTDPNAPPAATGSADPRNAVSILPPEDRPETGPFQLPPNLRRQEVSFATKEPAGTIVVDTPNTYLYYVLGNGRAIRYGVRVGREGFTWTGVQKITKKAEWPDWHPPPEMIERQPYLPRFMAGGEGNPLGARAMYLGSTVYRIHGTNQPSTIGKFVSSGCVGMLNDDVADLYERVKVGTRVVVLPGNPPPAVASAAPAQGPYSQGAAAAGAQPSINSQANAAPPVYRGDSRNDATSVQPLPPPTTIR